MCEPIIYESHFVAELPFTIAIDSFRLSSIETCIELYVASLRSRWGLGITPYIAWSPVTWESNPQYPMILTHSI